MFENISLSIVTPAFNRGNLLRRCFESLKKQTSNDFEWIVVDDGSVDDTESIVQSIKDTSNFPVIYVKKENGGKHTALNASHPYVHGKYVLILDSDDYLTNDAVETVLHHWNIYESKSDIGIVTFLKGYSVSEPNCYAKDENVPVDILRYKRICIKSSDCCEVIRTELFKKYPFPVFEGERFISEGTLWNRVATTHKCVYINQVIYICEYLEGGLTKSGRAMRIKNPYGGMFNSQILMQRKNYFTRRIKSGLLYDCYGYFAGLNPLQIVTKDSGYKTIKTICLIPGYLIYRDWKRKYTDRK